MDINCVVCNNSFKRYGKQAEKAKTCSKKCLGVLLSAKNNTKCTQCGKDFHIKESQKKRYKRNQGYFCSTLCVADFRKQAYLGENNPNFRIEVTTDQGYKLDYLPKFGRIKLHHKVVFETLNIKSIPKNMCVHHRDCVVENNSPENLALMSFSDHKWIHSQYGSAVLWAFCNNKITEDLLIEWSNDKERAKRLLTLNILNQNENKN